MNIRNFKEYDAYYNKGKDVEQAYGLFDALIKKLGIEAFIDFLRVCMEIMIDHVKSYPALKAINEFVEKVIQNLSPSRS